MVFIFACQEGVIKPSLAREGGPQPSRCQPWLGTSRLEGDLAVDE